MDPVGLIGLLVIGGVTGWLASVLTKGKGPGLVASLIIGVMGAVLGNLIFNILGVNLGAGLSEVLITAVVGAIVLLYLVSLIKK